MMSKTEKYMKKHDFNKNFKIITLKTNIYHISKKILRLGWVWGFITLHYITFRVIGIEQKLHSKCFKFTLARLKINWVPITDNLSLFSLNRLRFSVF
jgi:hypothetical protein